MVHPHPFPFVEPGEVLKKAAHFSDDCAELKGWQGGGEKPRGMRCLGHSVQL